MPEMTGPRKLVHGERESFIGGYRWQRNGPAPGSPVTNAGGSLGVWPGAAVGAPCLCRSCGWLLKNMVRNRCGASTSALACQPVGWETLSWAMSSRLAARAEARSRPRSSSCSRSSTICCSSVRMRC